MVVYKTRQRLASVSLYLLYNDYGLLYIIYSLEGRIKMAKRIDKKLEDEIIRLFKSGKYLLKDIAKIVGVSVKTVSKYLKKNGIKYVPHKLVTDYQIEEVCRLYTEDKLSEENIGIKLGLCKKTVRSILKSNNIEIRSPKDWLTKYSVDESYFEKIDTPNKAYYLGFLYADGNVGKNDNSIQLAIQARDVHILNQIKDDIKYDGSLYFSSRSKDDNNEQDIYNLSIKNEKLHNDLISLGVVPNKTHIIEYPNYIPSELSKDFIRGLLDGDGCIHGTFLKNGNPIYNVDICGNLIFCQGLKKEIESKLNIHCSIINIDKKRKIPTYRVSISGRLQCLKFLDWIYDNASMFLIRKYEIYLSHYKQAS